VELEIRIQTSLTGQDKSLAARTIQFGFEGTTIFMQNAYHKNDSKNLKYLKRDGDIPCSCSGLGLS
jgi:hypothetical protein